MTRRRDNGRARAIEALRTMPAARVFELGDALTGTTPGQHITIHELTCKWNRPGGTCTCARITLVCGATA